MVFVLKNNFARGELTKKALGRVDLELYGAGAEDLSNFIIVPHGGIRRRSGTRYCGEQRDMERTARPIPFIFSSTQSYVCEFGNTYIRFWTQGGQVFSGGSPVQVTSPYLEADLWGIQYVQSGDVLYLVHPDYKPRRLIRNSHTSWELKEVLFQDGPYYPLNDKDNKLYINSAFSIGDTRTLSWTDHEDINDGAGFTSADVGRHVRVKVEGKWVWFQIASVLADDEVTAVAKRIGLFESEDDDLELEDGTRTWRLGAFGGGPGYPGCASIIEGRMAYARTDQSPRFIGLSRSGFPDDFGPSATDGTVADGDGFSVEMFQGRADQILWLHEDRNLLIGTAHGIRSLGSSDNGDPLGLNTARQKIEINYGVSDVLPVAAGSNIIVAGRFGKSLRDLYFDFSVNSMVAPNISLLSDHLLKAGVVSTAYAQEPDSIIWALTGDGRVFGITYNKPEKIIGFHPHDFGGTVEGICVIPGSGNDELWLFMRREIDGETVRYVEFLERDFDEEISLKEDAFFVDCGATYDGVETATVSGLDHLEGESVALLADGSVLPNVTVSGGSITLPNDFTASKIHIGRPFTSRALLLRPPVQQQDGAIVGRRQRAVKAILEILSSLGVKVGSKYGNTHPLVNRYPSDPMGSSPQLRNGSFHAKLEDQWEDGGRVRVEVEDPLPTYIQFIMTQVDSER